MNPRIIIVLLAGVCLAALGFSLLRPAHSRQDLPATPEPSSRSQQQKNQSTSTPNVSVSENGNQQPGPNTQRIKQSSPELQARSVESGLQTWHQKIHKPIEFYGKVVDENDNPIKDAHISFSYNRLIPPEGSSKTNALSDQNGLFSLSGIIGGTLGVQVEKTGYYLVKSTNQAHFDYMDHSGSESFHPDSNQPIIFHLRKKHAGAELITSQYGVSRDLEISGLKDGSPVRVDFFNRKVGAEGQLELSAVKPPRGQSAPGWSFRMSIPEGGFVEVKDEFPFEAPESGYQPTVEYTFKPGETNWTETLHKQFYIAFGTPRRYGRIDLETGISTGVYLGYVINPDGSRNLEPMERKPESRALPPGVTEVIPPEGRH
jgi:hypothetical protein